MKWSELDKKLYNESNKPKAGDFDDLWAKVTPHLEEKPKKRRGVLWLWVIGAGSLVLGYLSFLAYNTDNSYGSIAAVSEIQKRADESISSNIQKMEDVDLSKIVVEDIINNPSSKTSVPEVKNTETTHKDVLSIISHQKDISQGKTDETIIYKGSMTAQDNPNTTEKGTVSEVKNDDEMMSEDIISEDKGNDINAVIKVASIDAKTQDNSITKLQAVNYVPMLNISMDYEMPIMNNLTIWTLVSTKQKVRRFAGLNTNIGYYLYQRRLTLTDMPSQEWYDHKLDKESTMDAQHYEVTARFVLSDKVSLNVGLSQTSLWEKWQDTYELERHTAVIPDQVVSREISTSGTTDIRGDIEVERVVTRQAKRYLQYRYIGVPLSITYQYPLRSAYIYGGIGGVYTFKTKGKGTAWYEGQEYDLSNDMDRLLSDHVIWVNAYAGLGKKLTRRLDLGLQMDIRNQLNSLYKDASGIDHRGLLYGLSTKINYNF